MMLPKLPVDRTKRRVSALKWYHANKSKSIEWRAQNIERIQVYHKRQRNKFKAIIREAKNKPCADCGQEYPYFCMDFDHVRGVKLFNIGNAAARNFSMAEILAEIAKCDVVCVMCHRWRTHSGEMEH